MKYLCSILIIMSISACDPQYRIIHKPNVILEQCLFEKFTEEEKDAMTEAVGRKTSRNKKSCESRQKRIIKNNKAHNLAHESK